MMPTFVAQIGQLQQDVRADENGLAHAVQFLAQFTHFDPCPRIEPGSRLVEQKDPWIVQQDSCHAEALLHPARK